MTPQDAPRLRSYGIALRAPRELPLDLRPLPSEAWSVASLIAAVARSHGLHIEQIKLHSNARALVQARREIYAQLHAVGWSSTRMARLFGFHHSTVLHALGKGKQGQL